MYGSGPGAGELVVADMIGGNIYPDAVYRAPSGVQVMDITK